MYERFTDRARKVMQLANREATVRGHEYIGAEHILLGLLSEGGSTLARVSLIEHGVTMERVLSVLNKVAPMRQDVVVTGKLPATPAAKTVIERAIQEARNLNNNYVGTEHLLIGLLSGENTAVAIMHDLNVQPEAVVETCKSYINEPTKLLTVPDISGLFLSFIAIVLDEMSLKCRVSGKTGDADALARAASILRAS